MQNPQTLYNLLNRNNYSIPLYQLNFSWTNKEITQLITDVLDSIKEKQREYFLGTLVVSKSGSQYSIIDGQQRVTAVLLIALAIQNEFLIQKRYVENINLSFIARPLSNTTLKRLLLNNKKPDTDHDKELLRGYAEILDALREYIDKEEYAGISIGKFCEYLFKKVKIFISIMPRDLDVNLYFERFNSRGEQLEYHEIIKAELMQKLYTEGIQFVQIQKFAKIWDACAEFETPCIRFFKKKIKGADIDEEREKVFHCEWSEYEPGKTSWRYGYQFDKLYENIVVNAENKRSLLKAIENSNDSEKSNEIDVVENDEANKYRCIINFNTFLYYVLYLTDNINPELIQLDDKKMYQAFKVQSRNSMWILKFGENLLKVKFIFDNCIIRSALETTNRRKEGDWFLQKAYREDKNEVSRGHLYVQTRFDKNTFPTYNNEILMLQSMFAVTFTAYKDTKWLYTTLRYLFTHSNQLNDHKFSASFFDFLESLSKTYARDRFMSNGSFDTSKFRYDKSVPVYAFSLTDYVLWKKRESLLAIYPTIKFDNFNFGYRRSVEHWYPQHPNESEGKPTLPDDLLHSFGNLCIVVASQNSKFGNLYPLAKFDDWRGILDSQSLKLQMMAAKTKLWDGWDETKRSEITKMEEEILGFVQRFMIT